MNDYMIMIGNIQRQNYTVAYIHIKSNSPCIYLWAIRKLFFGFQIIHTIDVPTVYIYGKLIAEHTYSILRTVTHTCIWSGSDK